MKAIFLLGRLIYDEGIELISTDIRQQILPLNLASSKNSKSFSLCLELKSDFKSDLKSELKKELKGPSKLSFAT
jgi:hypothetical protein